MSNSIPTYIVDSFTNEPFKGNPAGVCLVENPLTEVQMLSIAKELGLSETAFVVRDSEKEDHFSIRYFSPKMEIPLCGHASLAAAKTLFDLNDEMTALHFKTIEKLDLSIMKIGNSMAMKFPIYALNPIDPPERLLKALGVSEVLHSAYNQETKIILLELEKPDELRALDPDAHELLHSHTSINGVCLTAHSDNANYDFESRYFWPWSGTLEDPVTGGTHTFLAPYWSKQLKKSQLRSFQCSERTGEMTILIEDDKKIIIQGEATIFLKGNIALPTN